jgi:hypothetical protein
MRTTLALDDELVAKAQASTGLKEKSALVREALNALVTSARCGTSISPYFTRHFLDFRDTIFPDARGRGGNRRGQKRLVGIGGGKKQPA